VNVFEFSIEELISVYNENDYVDEIYGEEIYEIFGPCFHVSNDVSLHHKSVGTVWGFFNF
jgi:hypothetical protein